MKYVARKFTLPAANSTQTQERWDLAMLSAEAFTAKYGVTPTDYVDGKRSE